jgi:hypothetical protein
MRRAARVDANHAAFAEGMRQAGWLMHDTSRLGQGFPDWIGCSPDGCLCLFEVKNPSKSRSGQALTADEKGWHALWARAPVFVVRSTAEALQWYAEWAGIN